MKCIGLPLEFRGSLFNFCPLTGDLLVGARGARQQEALPKKLLKALECCDAPYRLSSESLRRKLFLTAVAKRSASKIAHRTKRIIAFNFFVGVLYASRRIPLFESCHDAILFFEKHPAKSPQEELCLPRSLFAAKTSKNFEDCGVILIGAFLPTKLMHAWIIEDGCHADPLDRVWTQYRPVAAIV